VSDNIKIELHLIQNFAPSCLNRDDANAPKDCEFGGVRRARISSQCVKRSARRSPEAEFSRLLEGLGGKRTRCLALEIAKKVSKSDKPDKQTLDAVIGIFEACGLEEDSKRKGEGASKILVFLDSRAIDDMAGVIFDALPALLKGKKNVEKDAIDKLASILAGAVRVPDIALFGRMLEVKDSTPFGKHNMQVHAAVQVAHAISTHRVDMDFDFFTAVDDLNPEADTGAGMMGETGFNSACFYRYALIDRNQLVKNLGGDEALAHRVIRAFIEASVIAIPTGKQNSFAAQNPPDFGMIVVKKNGFPCSLANAFAQPVRPDTDADLIGHSIQRLCELHPKIKHVYGAAGTVDESLWHLGYDDRLGQLKGNDRHSFAAALDAAMKAVTAAAEA
jgi:CRISPR system Cascade subunit CasC